MQCRNCGTLFYTQFCPNCGTPANSQNSKKPIFKKWWFWVIITVVLLIVIGNNGQTSSNDLPPSPNTSDSANSQSTLQSTTPAKENQYYWGDVVNANGLKITYVSAEKWEPVDFFPDDGYEFIRLKISAENTSTVDRYIDAYEFTCYADGKKESHFYLAHDILKGGMLSPGRRDEGYIYFSVPLDAKEIEVEYEPTFWNGKKAIFVLKSS